MTAERKLSYLYAVVGLLSILAASFLIALIVVLLDHDGQTTVEPTVPSPTTTQRPPTYGNYCLTDGCRRAAQTLRLAVNLEADPCQDFYEYACGLWSRLNPIEEGSAQRTSFSVLVDQNSADLKQVLGELSSEQTANASIGLLKVVYDACMDEQSIEEAGSKPLRDILERAFPGENGLGKMEFLSNSNGDGSLESLVARLWLLFGVSSIISPYVSADQRNTTVNILTLEQASLSLGSKSEDYYLKNDSFHQSVRDAYAVAAKKIFRLISDATTLVGMTADDIDSMVERIMNFEIALAGINTPPEKRRDPTETYNKMTVQQLQEAGNNFIWSDFLKLFKPCTHVNVAAPEYFRKLNVLLGRTDRDTVYQYLVWRLIWSRLRFLERRYSNVFYEFLKKFKDEDREKERSKYCVGYVTGDGEGQEFLGFAVGQVFLDKKNFDKESKSDVEKMVIELRKAFKHLLDENTWMDDVTKQEAKEKIDQMISSVGYPDNLGDLDSIYKPLLEKQPGYKDTVINPGDSFFEMNTKIRSWHNQKQNSRIGEPYDRHSFGGSPVTVNAWYAPNKNSIVFPAGILQPPFYDRTSPPAFNFGSMGSVIGHEITHGFDDQGAEYDGTGNLKKWWTNSSKEKFDEKVRCFVDQYSKFCYPEFGEHVCVKGENTKGENIADNAGIKQSFAAYRAITKERPHEVLPSLEQFTMDQIFFLSFAHFWCGNFKSNYLQNTIETNEHAPGRNRVIGTLQNFDEFAKAFDCPIGSVMNPEKKCVVW